MTENDLENFYIFTDGSSFNNQKKQSERIGGYGVFYPSNIELNISKNLTGKVTNNIAELSAVYYGIIKAITHLNIKKPIMIISDSMYLINSISLWAKKWEKNNWKKSDGKPVQNVELVKKIYYLVNNLNIKFKHQKSHKSPPKDKNSKEYFYWYGNDQADKLATQKKF